jgi:uncharacterized protein
MHIWKSLRPRIAALATSALFTVAPAMPLHAGAAPPTDHVIAVTREEVDASNAKVKAAFADLASMWTADFQRIGERFAVPRLARYRSAVRTPCGVMQRNNAGYCASDNTIYYDDVFVAAQAKSAARVLQTDGDMASLGVIAHEVGHAVAIQLGYASRVSYDNESTADCLAGAFARHAGENGALEPGDLDEAFFGMAAAGDPTPQLTGNGRVDRRILARAAALGHGTREQRVQNFREGYASGAGACLDVFSS